jgi:murein DD-endopeptidase MepM/ murein hydrolase activator NlpD
MKLNGGRKMSRLSDLIFHNKENYITSPYGYRNVISTSKGNTRSFHDGVDYGTNGVKLAQYPIDNGVIISCGTDYGYGGAKYVWVKYPRLGVKMLHYHLDSIKVKANQTVDKNTILGYTGKTGKATGIHLHLGLKLLSGGGYIDPEAWFNKNYKDPPKVSVNKTESFLPDRGYFTKGDEGENVKKINEFYYKVFPAYAKTLKRNKKDVRGKLFGENTEAWTKEFQKNTGLEVDGNIGPLTLAKLVEFGFKY